MKYDDSTSALPSDTSDAYSRVALSAGLSTALGTISGFEF